MKSCKNYSERTINEKINAKGNLIITGKIEIDLKNLYEISPLFNYAFVGLHLHKKQ